MSRTSSVKGRVRKKPPHYLASWLRRNVQYNIIIIMYVSYVVGKGSCQKKAPTLFSELALEKCSVYVSYVVGKGSRQKKAPTLFSELALEKLLNVPPL